MGIDDFTNQGLDSSGQPNLQPPVQNAAPPKAKFPPAPNSMMPPSNYTEPTPPAQDPTPPTREPAATPTASDSNDMPLEDNGKATLDKLKAGGFSDDDISAYQGQQNTKLQQAGFSQKEIGDYWGTPTPTNDKMKAVVTANVDAYHARQPIDTEVKPLTAESWEDQIAASWGMSVSGLAIHGKPTFVQPENQSFAMKMLSGVTGLIGDAPAMLVGGLAGGAAGAAAGTATLPVVGTVGGLATGAAVGTWAAPAAIRKMFVDHYEKGDIQDTHDLITRFAGTTLEALKGGTIGLLTEGAGKIATTAAQGVAGATASTVAKLSAEVATMTTAGAALEGRMPKFEDFAQGALLVGGMHGVGAILPRASVESKLLSIYEKTGEHPADIVQKANTDVILKQELLSSNPDVPLLPEDPYPGTDDAEHAADAHAKLKELDQPESEDKAVNTPQDPEETRNLPNADDKMMLGQIGEAAEIPKETVQEKIDKMRFNFIDKFDPLKKAGAQKAYELATTNAAFGDKMSQVFNEGVRDLKTGEVKGEGALNIFNDNQEANNDPGNQKLLAYWMALRGKELDARGIKSLFPTAEHSDAASRIIEAGKAQFQPFIDRLTKESNLAVDYYRDADGVSDKDAAAIKAANKSHVPLNTIQEYDEMTGRVGSGTKKPLQEIMGSLAQKVDPITSYLKNIERLHAEADKNIIRQELVKDVADGFLREETGKTRVKTEGAEDLAAGLGVDSDSLESALDTHRKESVRVGENSFEVKTRDENGDIVRKVYTGDPLTIQSIKMLDGDFQQAPLLGKIAKAFTTATRIGAVDNPGFMTRHIYRSGRAAMFYSQTGLTPFSMLATLPDFFREPQVFKDWLYNGGAVGSMEGIDRNYIDKEYFQVRKDTDGNYTTAPPPLANRAWSVVKDAPHVFTAVIKQTDNMWRYAEYKNLVEKQGMDPQEAAFQARKVTVDYQRAGAIRTVLKDYTAFMNVHIQVTDRAFQEAMDPERQKGYAMKVMAGTVVPSLILWAATKDDSRIKDLPYWQKAMNWNVPIDHWREANNPLEFTNMPDDMRRMEGEKYMVNDGTVMKIPVAGAPDMIFGTALGMSLNAFANKNPDEAKAAAGSILGEFARIPVPNMVAPAIEQWANKNLFTGRGVVSPQNENLLPYEQYTAYTTDTARQIGKLIGYVPLIRDIGPKNHTLASPEVIDNYIRDWTGGAGATALSLIEGGEHKLGFGIEKNMPAKYWDELPVLKDWFTHYPSSKAQPIDDFHERYNQASQIMATMKDQIKKGDFAGAQQTQSDYGGQMDRIQGIAHMMQMQQRLVKATIADSNMNPTDKRQLITTTYYQMLQGAKAGNKMMDAAEQAYKTSKQGGGN